METVSILILTHNEEKNIEKCILSLQPLTKNICVVDSFSDDDTVKVCETFGVNVKQPTVRCRRGWRGIAKD